MPLTNSKDGQLRGLAAWLSSKRIAISFLTFTSLICINLLVFRTQPYHPFRSLQYGNVLGTSLVILGLVIRSWAAGTLHKSREVTTAGPYSLVRNPLYVGSFLMMFGFCILMKDCLSTFFVAGPMAALYWFQVRFEERNLSEWFSEDWENYARSTGRFFPRRISRQLLAPWSLQQWRRNREYQALIASLIGLAVLSLLFFN